MKSLCCQDNSGKCAGKWLLSISALVGALTIVGVCTLWLYKKYKNCTSVFSDDGSMDCSGCDCDM